jgi:ElaB/YqjD/DUF883 family membrane-anchored ribosome-binding protein
MEITDKAANLAHEAFDKIASTTHQAAETLGEKGEQLKNTEQQLMKNCRGYVRDNPITSVLITAAVSFVLGRLSSRCKANRQIL